MRIELQIGLLMNALSIILTQFHFLPAFAEGFLSGILTALGLFFIIVSVLPENTYNNLAYKKFLKNRMSD